MAFETDKDVLTQWNPKTEERDDDEGVQGSEDHYWLRGSGL